MHGTTNIERHRIIAAVPRNMATYLLYIKRIYILYISFIKRTKFMFSSSDTFHHLQCTDVLRHFIGPLHCFCFFFATQKEQLQSKLCHNSLMYVLVITHEFNQILIFVCPCIANIFPNYCQQDASFINLFFSTEALHVSGGSSAHHQEHTTVHTASDIVNQYCCLLLPWMRWNAVGKNKLRNVASCWQKYGNKFN